MKILFFDGYCSLCSHLVDWVIARDKQRQIKFASLQSETAKKWLGHHENLSLASRQENTFGEKAPTDLAVVSQSFDFETVVYLRNSVKLERSAAILGLIVDLGGIWKCAQIFYLVPAPIRDAVYRLIARNRFRLFKKRDTCRLPTPDEKERLLP